MSWLLIAILLTPQGPVSYSAQFDYQFECTHRLDTLKRQYPGTTGNCSHI